jgi:hypothetical protein
MVSLNSNIKQIHLLGIIESIQIHSEYIPHTIQIHGQIHLKYIENDPALIILKALTLMQCKV